MEPRNADVGSGTDDGNTSADVAPKRISSKKCAGVAALDPKETVSNSDWFTSTAEYVEERVMLRFVSTL